MIPAAFFVHATHFSTAIHASVTYHKQHFSQNHRVNFAQENQKWGDPRSCQSVFQKLLPSNNPQNVVLINLH